MKIVLLFGYKVAEDAEFGNKVQLLNVAVVDVLVGVRLEALAGGWEDEPLVLLFRKQYRKVTKKIISRNIAAMKLPSTTAVLVESFPWTGLKVEALVPFDQ